MLRGEVRGTTLIGKIRFAHIANDFVRWLKFTSLILSNVHFFVLKKPLGLKSKRRIYRVTTLIDKIRFAHISNDFVRWLKFTHVQKFYPLYLLRREHLLSYLISYSLLQSSFHINLNTWLPPSQALYKINLSYSLFHRIFLCYLWLYSYYIHMFFYCQQFLLFLYVFLQIFINLIFQ